MKRQLLILVLALQAAWMLATIYRQERTLDGSTHVLLEVEPIDPRDWIRGDYLRLRYPISNLPKDRFHPPLDRHLPGGTPVYVVLQPTNGIHQLDFATLTRPASPSGPVLRGRVLDPSVHARGVVQVDYGLKRYYVREGTGNPHGRLTAEVAIPASGRGLLRQLLLDGQPYEQAMRPRAPGGTNAP